MSIFLIRHGETAGNARRVMQHPHTPLSADGIAQADRLARRLADAGIAHILASDMARAERTARAVHDATGAPLELEPLLHERNFGDLRGRPYAEFDFDPFAPEFVPPAGESWAVFHERVDRAWARVTELALSVDGHLAVVTHGLVCHSVATRWVELPEGAASTGRDGPPLRFGNTAVTTVVGPDPWRVERLACTAHLDAVADGAPV